jgi:hypothetical protein
VIKGALISFVPTFVGSLPNVVVFQYNPETMTHTWSAAAEASAPPAKAEGDPLASGGVPSESFSFKLLLDSNDTIADGGANPVAAALATASGVYTRLAALEMLQYPLPKNGAAGLVGSVSASVGAGGLSASVSGGSSAPTAPVPSFDLPLVLFVWGPLRILPVRVSELSITETLYDELLNPVHAEVSITLKVLTLKEINGLTQGDLKQIAQVAYSYTQGLRQVQAVANLGGAAAILGMLPNPF